VIGISLLLFIVSDFFGSNTSQRRKANKYYQLATIDGESVSYQEFEARVQDLADIYKMSGSTEINEEMMQSLREQVWQQMLSEKLMGKTYRQVGLGASALTRWRCSSLVTTAILLSGSFLNDPAPAPSMNIPVNFLKATET
jgi:peptidyl-prolyl cis-trans isomerase D